MSNKIYRAVGLMSGTSMDGIDAAIIETDGYYCVRQLSSSSIEYNNDFQFLLKAAEYATKYCKGDLNKTAHSFPKLLQEYLAKNYQNEYPKYLETFSFQDIVSKSTELHSDLVLKLLQESGYLAKEIDYIGYHGQSLYHAPKNKITIQVGDGQFLADNTNIPVINNFRANDIRHNGQGAPLAPIYHKALAIRDNLCPLLVLNLGGIANLTYITSNQLMGFDCGPANVLIDRFVRKKTNNIENFDTNGSYGLKGKVDKELITTLYQQSLIIDNQNFYELTPPKSLDPNNFINIPEINNLSLEDGCATLASFSAYTVCKAIDYLNIAPSTKIIIAGGGAKNKMFIKAFKKYSENKIHIIEQNELTWDTKYLEAELFAYLAVRSALNLPISFPSTTGASNSCTAGEIYFTKKIKNKK